MTKINRRKLVTRPGWRVSCNGLSDIRTLELRKIAPPVSLIISGTVSVPLAQVISEFNLQELTLENCEISPANLIAAVSEKSLESLTLRGMEISRSLLHAIPESLQSLVLLGCCIDAEGLSSLVRINRLDELTLSLASFHGAVDRTIELKTVRLVDFSGSALTDTMLSKFRFGSRLESVSLLHTLVTRETAISFKSKYDFADVWYEAISEAAVIEKGGKEAEEEEEVRRRGI